METLIHQMIATLVLLLFPVWRIYKRAGLNPYLSLLLFLPVVGGLICTLILIFSKWNLNRSKGEV